MDWWPTYVWILYMYSIHTHFTQKPWIHVHCTYTCTVVLLYCTYLLCAFSISSVTGGVSYSTAEWGVCSHLQALVLAHTGVGETSYLSTYVGVIIRKCVCTKIIRRFIIIWFIISLTKTCLEAAFSCVSIHLSLTDYPRVSIHHHKTKSMPLSPSEHLVSSLYSLQPTV